MSAWVLVRLALVNSIGYAGTTIVPLWVGGIGHRMGMPNWFGGAIATAQLSAAALLNLLTPVLFRNVPPVLLARIALPSAAVIYLATLLAEPRLFALACVVGGACLGVVLNATNRIVAASAEVQRGFSIFLLTEGVFSSTMFYSGALLSEHLGLIWVFLTLPVVTLLGATVMITLPAHQLGVTINVTRAAGGRIRLPTIFGLCALFIFFCGQSCINASALTIGRAAGLSAQTASAAIAIGVIVGMAGAVVSRLLGERFGVRAPILTGTLVLVLVVFAMTQVGGPATFYGGILWVQVTTFFIVPYFFTMLARLDVSGRAASIGPAFLLAGVALGPSLAAWTIALWSPAALGPVASIALLGSAAFTSAAAASGTTPTPVRPLDVPAITVNPDLQALAGDDHGA